MKRAALAVLLFGLACGSEGLHPAFAKTWIASATVSIPGISSLNYGSTLSVTVSGTTGAVNVVCLSGGGSFNIIGSGNSASWSAGVVSCEVVPDPLQPCRITLTFTSSSLTLRGENLLSGTGTGTATGCNLSNVAFSTTFDAVPKPPPAPPP